MIAELRVGHHQYYVCWKGHTRTTLSCISTTGFVTPPCIIYSPRTKVPKKFKEGTGPWTYATVRMNGYTQTFIYNSSHKTNCSRPRWARITCQIQLIQLAHANNAHVHCLLTNTTHLFQPLDLAVFKSSFSKACSLYRSQHIITNDRIASLISSAVSNTK